MAVQAAQVAVSTTAVDLTASAPGDRVAGSSIVVTAPDAADLYVGPSGVTATTGFRVKAGTTLSGGLDSNERLFAVLASGTGTAYVLRTGV
jgi:hypothetical protein